MNNIIQQIMRQYQEWLIEQRIKKEQEQMVREEMAKKYAKPGISDSGTTLEQMMRMGKPQLMKAYDRQVPTTPPATMQEMFPPTDDPLMKKEGHLWMPHPSLRDFYKGLL